MITNPAVLHYGQAAEAVLCYLDQNTAFGEVIVELDDETRTNLIESIAYVLHTTLFNEPIYRRGYNQAISEVKLHMERLYNEVQ